MTFLNTTEEGAWYALSTDRYPLLTSCVQIAPWAQWHQAHDNTEGKIDDDGERGLKKQDLVGIHPIAKTMEMNIDSPGLPAPNMPGLIEGGDWQQAHRGMGRLNVVKEHSLWVMVTLLLLLFAFWKRKALMSGTLFRGLDRTPTIVAEEAAAETRNEETVPLTEKKGLDDEAHVAAPSTVSAEDAPALPEKKRRKRGQRGGKNNKKKVGFVDAATDVDDDDQGEIGEPSGAVQVSNSPTAGPKDSLTNDQGNHNIDGLTVTDKLLGSPSHPLPALERFFIFLGFEFITSRYGFTSVTNFCRQWKSRNVCVRRNLGGYPRRRQTHANRKL